jgi:hypothetical protein
MTPLDDTTIDKVSSFLKEIRPLDQSIKIEMNIIPRVDSTSLYAVKATHYIILTSEEKEGFLTNAGFILEQVDLFLSANGLGACWLGMAKPDKSVLDTSKLKFVIMLAFGRPTEKLHRESSADFKRKPIGEVADFTELESVMKAVRLTPSGVNSQPWQFTKSEALINAYCIKPGLLKGIIYERMNKIDMGIALCFLWLALVNEGKKFEIVKDERAENNPPKKCYYITSVRID